MAALRLWAAGFGTFLLARSWGYSRAGRWLCGLSFPFCGFLAGWLLYPVASVATWLPWLFLATDRALDGRRFGIAATAVAVGFTLLGGHVQTSAHALLAVGLYAVWRSCAGRVWPVRWTLGVILGVGLSAVEIVPLASYLARSPVWADRAADRPPLLAVSPPRVLDAATTAFPYLFGSQRRGHPNLAKAVGVHNLNEAAGGFSGLAALIWLAPGAWSARRGRPRVRFLAGMLIVGAMGAFDVFPVANMLRCVPVLNVADNRRAHALGRLLADDARGGRDRRDGEDDRLAAVDALDAMLVRFRAGFCARRGGGRRARAADSGTRDRALRQSRRRGFGVGPGRIPRASRATGRARGPRSSPATT